MCWFQGEGHKSMPKRNRLCVKKWRELNPDWEVNVLDRKKIKDYVPEFFDIVRSAPPRRVQAKSDLLRILLLEKFGGVWVDVSVYPTCPLSSFYPSVVNETGFFAYRFTKKNRPSHWGKKTTVSWFLCADWPNHYLISKWREAFVYRFVTYKKWPYFTFHHTLTFLCKKDEKVRDIVNGMVQIDQRIPHSACHKDQGRIEPSYMYKRPRQILNCNPICK
jgi:hypothetical protein